MSRTRQRYLIYGLVVESEIPLTSVEPCGDAAAPVGLVLHLAPTDWFRRRTPDVPQDSDDWIRHVVLGDGSVYIRVHEVFEAIVAPDGSSVACAPLGDDDDRAVEAHLVTFALSAALTLQGEECLHATVVGRQGRTVGLIGPSGAGKSTLAAFLIARGAHLVTDDMLRLAFAPGAVRAYPGPGRLKLFEDTAHTLLPDATSDGGFSFNRFSGKLMFRSAGLAVPAGPVALAALFWLGAPAPSGEPPVEVRALAGMEKAKVLLASAMNIRYVAPERLARQMAFVERLAQALPVHALGYERRYALLPRVADEIWRAIGLPAAGA
ncbi:MAG TPA: hypothetical protein VMI56_12395 [Reyranella sp.]|nr:hypothetical protein [Reyranella sp.]